MMTGSFTLIIAGILLVVSSVYILIKTKKNKEAVVDIKQTYKIILAIFLIGICSICAYFVIRWVDNTAESFDVWDTMRYLIPALLMTVAFLLFRQAKKEKQKGNNYAMAAFISIGVIIIAGIILNAWLSTVISSAFRPDPPDAWKTKDNKTMAYVMMQDFVKANLTSPASAKFEWITEPNCVITKNGFDYSISSWVDSQNAFGVMIRTQFSGTVRQADKDNWHLQYLRMDDKRAYIDWDWVKNNNLGKINVDKFIFNFKTLMNYFVWEDAEKYVVIDYNTDPIDIRTNQIGEYIIKIYHDADGYVNKAMFSYVGNDTKYQSDMSHKVFSAFVNAIEFLNTVDEIREIIREIYSNRSEIFISNLGNKYLKNVAWPNFSYSVEIYD